ncbi:MAG TPA: hypothetical protein VE569_04885, partial [Acidimicrobiia bacterium]|nr:hypothetical protein [Acidimicrobiia bacterium]
QGVAPPGDEPPTNGLRDSGEALQVGYQAGLFGSFDDDEPEVLAVELSAEYKTAVEMIKTSWVWMLGLAVLVATLIVTGLERHGSFKENVN